MRPPVGVPLRPDRVVVPRVHEGREVLDRRLHVALHRRPRPLRIALSAGVEDLLVFVIRPMIRVLMGYQQADVGTRRVPELLDHPDESR